MRSLALSFIVAIAAAGCASLPPIDLVDTYALPGAGLHVVTVERPSRWPGGADLVIWVDGSDRVRQLAGDPAEAGCHLPAQPGGGSVAEDREPDGSLGQPEFLPHGIRPTRRYRTAGCCTLSLVHGG